MLNVSIFNSCSYMCLFFNLQPVLKVSYHFTFLRNNFWKKINYTWMEEMILWVAAFSDTCFRSSSSSSFSILWSGLSHPGIRDSCGKDNMELLDSRFLTQVRLGINALLCLVAVRILTFDQYCCQEYQSSVLEMSRS